jgi:transcriptional regulator with XRE-family HTH domain
MADLDQVRSAVVRARKELRLGQADVAARARVALSTLRAFEQGRLGEIGFSKLNRIVTAVGLELDLRASRSARPTLDDLRSEDPDD